MNITILDYTIFSIPYISQKTSTSLITDQFLLDTRQNIYVVAIVSEDNSFASTDVQVDWGKQKHARSSSVTLTLSQRHPSALISFEEHQDLFDQVRPLLEPTFHHHEVLSNGDPEKPSNFGQSLKVPNQVNFMKGSYAIYD